MDQRDLTVRELVVVQEKGNGDENSRTSSKECRPKILIQRQGCQINSSFGAGYSTRRIQLSFC